MATTTKEATDFNGRTSSKGLISYLGHCYKNNLITDQSLKDMVLYTAKKFKQDSKSVTKKDLYYLATQVRGLLANTVETVKQAIPKKPVEASTKTGSKSLPMAKFFPPEIVTEEGLKLVAVPNKYTTIEELRDAINEEGKNIVFATYWTKRHLKQYNYKELYHLKKVEEVTSFPNDVDIMSVHEVLDTEDTVICVSAYTDAVGLFFGDELKPVEDVDENGDKFSIRFSNSMEFEVYELVEDEEETEDDTEEEETSEEPDEEVEDSEEEEEEIPEEEEETSEEEETPKNKSKSIRRRRTAKK